jgi:hypothetical protein
MVDAPILAGPGSDYGFIATAPAGSTVEKTGHVIDGYVTVQYAEVTGWVALEHLGVPGMRVEEPSLGETTPLIEDPPADAAPAKPPPIELAPKETSPAETPPSEAPTTETTPAEAALDDEAPVDMAPVDAP